MTNIKNPTRRTFRTIKRGQRFIVRFDNGTEWTGRKSGAVKGTSIIKVTPEYVDWKGPVFIDTAKTSDPEYTFVRITPISKDTPAFYRDGRGIDEMVETGRGDGIRWFESTK